MKMKRLLDLIFILLSAPLWLPVFIITAVVVLLSHGRPIFFRQKRAGLGGKSFTISKFRTMIDSFGADGNLLPDEDRMTKTGCILRNLSLDELPELWHVITGEMNLVGPRPLPVAYTARYSLEQARRLEVRPGLTGWAQVNGRNNISWEERFEKDVWYVDNQSIWLDLRILLLTVAAVLKRSDISAPGAATMPEFKGSNPDQDV